MLFVGDDWAEDHHDVEVVDEAGTVLAKRRLPEELIGVTALHCVDRLSPHRDECVCLRAGLSAQIDALHPRGPRSGACLLPS